jgi:hypothetical protein
VLAYKYLEMLPRLAQSGNGYFVIPGELTEAVRTVTSAFAGKHGGNAAEDAPGTVSTGAVGPVARPQAVAEVARATELARAAADEARIEAEQARQHILG